MAVLGGSPYSYFRYETHLAVERALDVFDEIVEEFSMTFGRRYDKVDAYRMEDAEAAVVLLNSAAETAKAVADKLRGQGESDKRDQSIPIHPCNNLFALWARDQFFPLFF